MKIPKGTKVTPAATKVTSNTKSDSRGLKIEGQVHLRYNSLDPSYVENRFKDKYHQFYYPNDGVSLWKRVWELWALSVVPDTALEEAMPTPPFKDHNKMKCPSKQAMKFGVVYMLGLAAFVSLGCLCLSFTDISSSEITDIMWMITVSYSMGFLVFW